MKAGISLAAAFAAAGLAGCATAPTSGPVEVSRFHLGAPLERGTLAIQAQQAGAASSLEFRTYADAVQAELSNQGYAPAAGGAPSQYLGIVGFARTTEQGPPRRSPVSIGLGGGGYSGGYRGGGVGLGGGISFPVGKRRPNEFVLSQMSVQIRRRSDGTVIWEGRAETGAPIQAPEAQPGVAARKLAHALFLGFPGESGRTITVK